MKLCEIENFPLIKTQEEFVEFLFQYDGISVPSTDVEVDITNWVNSIKLGIIGHDLVVDDKRYFKEPVTTFYTPIRVYYHEHRIASMMFEFYKVNDVRYKYYMMYVTHPDGYFQ